MAMANFVITLPKLTSLANYPFLEICVKSILALITYPRVVFATDYMLNTLALPQTTDVDEIARRNFLGPQALAVPNSTLPDNLLMYGQFNTEILWAHLQTFIKISSLASIFADY